jgi:hypothetical protein
MSCTPMMVLASGALETCLRAMETRRPSCIGRLARDLLMFVTRGPQGTAGCAIVLEPSHQGGTTRSHRTHSGVGALLSRKAGPRATGHVVVPKPSVVGRRGPEPLGMRPHQSPP